MSTLGIIRSQVSSKALRLLVNHDLRRCVFRQLSLNVHMNMNPASSRPTVSSEANDPQQNFHRALGAD